VEIKHLFVMIGRRPGDGITSRYRRRRCADDDDAIDVRAHRFEEVL